MNKDNPPDTPECSSSPCMLYALGMLCDQGMLHDPDASATEPGGLVRAEIAGDDWAEVRLWRKAKRQVLIERRLSLSAEDRAAHRDAVTAVLSTMLDAEPGGLVGFYWPFKGEFDPRPLVFALHAKGMRFALPVVIGKAQALVFRQWWPGMRMSSGVWGIPVPCDGEAVSPDILLVPLVGFDKRGFRLGYGGGYYDRTLAAALAEPGAIGKPRTIGIGFDRLEIPTIYPQPHDIPMDCIVTERRRF